MTSVTHKTYVIFTKVGKIGLHISVTYFFERWFQAMNTNWFYDAYENRISYFLFDDKRFDQLN